MKNFSLTDIAVRSLKEHHPNISDISSMIDSERKRLSDNWRDTVNFLGIQAFTVYLKPGSAYRFLEPDIPFLLQFLSTDFIRYSEPFRTALGLMPVPLTQKTVNDNFVIQLYEGIYHIFENVNVPNDVLQQLGIQMDNILNYHLRKKRLALKSISPEIDQLIESKFSEYDSHIHIQILRSDLYQWLVYLQKDLQEENPSPIANYDELFDIMKELREADCDDICEKLADTSDISDYEENYNYTQLKQASEKIDADKTLNSYSQKIQKEFKGYTPKQGSIMRKKETISETLDAIKERVDIIISETCPDLSFNENDDSFELMPAGQLIKLALSQQKDLN